MPMLSLASWRRVLSLPGNLHAVKHMLQKAGGVHQVSVALCSALGVPSWCCLQVLEFVPETVYRIAKHYTKMNQRMPMLYVTAVHVPGMGC